MNRIYFTPFQWINLSPDIINIYLFHTYQFIMYFKTQLEPAETSENGHVTPRGKLEGNVLQLNRVSFSLPHVKFRSKTAAESNNLGNNDQWSRSERTRLRQDGRRHLEAYLTFAATILVNGQ